MSISSQTRDLWPDDLGLISVVPPVAILREQAEVLAGRTRGLIEGEVAQTERSHGVLDQYLADLRGELFYSFRLRVPALGGYRYELLRIWHGARLYPVHMHYLPDATQCDAEDESQFVEWLRAFFSHEETKRVISALIAQVALPGAGK